MGIFHPPVFTGHKKKDQDQKEPALKRLNVFRLALGAGTVLILFCLFSAHLIPSKVSLQVGDISPEDIRAHKNVRSYVDTMGTERRRNAAASQVDKQYRDLPNAKSDAVDALTNAFAVLSHARNDASLRTPTSKIAAIRQDLRVDVSGQGLNDLLSLSNYDFSRVQEYAVQLVKEIMGHEIRDDNNDVEKAHAEFRRRISNYFRGSSYAGMAADIVARYITPNRVYDPDITEKLRQRRFQSVPSEYKQIAMNEMIIEKGEHVTREHIDKLTALGLRNPQVDYSVVLCIFLLMSGVTVSVIVYLARHHPRIYRSDKLMLLLALIVILCVLGLKLGGSMLGIKLNGQQFGFFTMSWIAMAGMMIAALLEPQLAIVVVAFLATTAGVVMNDELRWAFAAMITGMVAIYAVSDVKHRSGLIRASAVVCGVNLSIIWLVGTIAGDELSDLYVGAAWAVAGGLISVMLFALGTAMLEKPFGITTHNRLVELSDTNHPMLRRLLMEAPGTYSHSIYVGNIAAMAADIIGADSLLVRVAAYYHDIGKIRRAHFFVENQHVENVHDRLNPSLSALVIRSHIKDGLDLAREYKLPPLVCELMSQHHGTSLVRYFYTQAAVESGGSTALEQQFRYEETKPQTREAALLMLADSVEAASRTLSRPTPGQIEDMVDGIVLERLSDGQLDESELTFKEIRMIRDSFVRTLTSMMHSRIEYPDMPNTEARKGVANGNNSKESGIDGGGSDKTDKSREEIVAG